MENMRISQLTASLANLDDMALWLQTKAAAEQEKQCCAAVIAHIAELKKRKLFLLYACKSIFDYCCTVLGYSESKSYLRCQVAGACIRHPELLEDLAAGAISLCVAGKLASRLSEENKEQLLPACHGKTKHQAEVIIAAHLPESVKDSPANKPELVPLSADEYVLRLPITKNLLAKLQRCAEVLGIASMKAQLPELLEKIATITLAAKDPELKATQQAARKKSGARKLAAPSLATPVGSRSEDPSSRPREVTSSTQDSPRTRNIPAATRREVLRRAGYQCQFVTSEGQRCSQRTFLQVDHLQAFAKNGSHESANLQILCQQHNNLKGAQEFGSV